MDVISLADAKARLGELLYRVEAGDSIEITRRGKPVARLIPVTKPRQPVDGTLLRALTAAMHIQPKNAPAPAQPTRDDDRHS